MKGMKKAKNRLVKSLRVVVLEVVVVNLSSECSQEPTRSS